MFFAIDAKAQGVVSSTDSLATQHTSTRYEVAKTSPDNEKDLERKAVDLRNPENLTTETTYDDKTHMYIVGNKKPKEIHLNWHFSCHSFHNWYKGLSADTAI